jgi:hypothetical protein
MRHREETVKASRRLRVRNTGATEAPRIATKMTVVLNRSAWLYSVFHTMFIRKAF